MAYLTNSNMATNNRQRKRHEPEYNFHSDDFSQHNFDHSNTNKKARIDNREINSPSRVVYVRNVPSQLDDTSLSYLAVPFGLIENMVFVRKNSQVLIEMQKLEDAVKMVDYFTETAPSLSIFGRYLSIQFSKHQQLDSKHENSLKIVANANEKREYYVGQWESNEVSGGCKEILCVLIDKAPNLIINHLVFLKIFGRFGKVERVVSYTKKGQHFGLVEFKSAVSAHVAQLQLNNKHLLGDSGKMKIDFSKVPGPLFVERQSEKVRDYNEKPASKADEREMASPHYDFPLFSENNNRQTAEEQQSSMMMIGGGDYNNPEDRYVSNIGNYINNSDRRQRQYNNNNNMYDGGRSMMNNNNNNNNSQSGAELASAIRLMSYLNPGARMNNNNNINMNRGFRG